MKVVFFVVFALCLGTGLAITCGEARDACCDQSRSSTLNCSCPPDYSSELASCQTSAAINATNLVLYSNFLYESYWFGLCLTYLPSNATFDDVLSGCLEASIEFLINTVFQNPLEAVYVPNGYIIMDIIFPDLYRNFTTYAYDLTWGKDYCDGTLPFVRCRAPTQRKAYLDYYTGFQVPSFPPCEMPAPWNEGLGPFTFLDYSEFCLDTMFSSSTVGFCSGTQLYGDSATDLSGLYLPFNEVSPFYVPSEDPFFPIDIFNQLDYLVLSSDEEHHPIGWPWTWAYTVFEVDALYIHGINISFAPEVEYYDDSLHSDTYEALHTHVLLLDSLGVERNTFSIISAVLPLQVLALFNVSLVGVPYERFAVMTDLKSLYLDTVAFNQTILTVPNDFGLFGLTPNLTSLVLRDLTFSSSISFCGTSEVVFPLEKLAIESFFVGGWFDFAWMYGCTENVRELYLDGKDEYSLCLPGGNFLEVFPNLEKLTLKNLNLSNTVDFDWCAGPLTSLTLINVQFTSGGSVGCLFNCTFSHLEIRDSDTGNSTLSPVIKFDSESELILINDDFIGEFPLLIGDLDVLIVDSAGAFSDYVDTIPNAEVPDDCLIINSGSICPSSPGNCCGFLYPVI
jgi:hypothetical protein